MYVLTQQGQLIFCNIDIKSFEDTLMDNLIFNYVISQFHREEITGMDVCIRK
jgi:hypothetical protein